MGWFAWRIAGQSNVQEVSEAGRGEWPGKHSTTEQRLQRFIHSGRGETKDGIPTAGLVTLCQLLLGTRQVLAYMVFGFKASHAPNIMLRCGPPSPAPSVLKPACLVSSRTVQGLVGGITCSSVLSTS